MLGPRFVPRTFLQGRHRVPHNGHHHGQHQGHHNRQHHGDYGSNLPFGAQVVKGSVREMMPVVPVDVECVGEFRAVAVAASGLLEKPHVVGDEGVDWPPMDIDPDTFGVSVCSLVLDMSILANRTGKCLHRWIRVVKTLLLLFGCMAIQICMVFTVLRFVCNEAVHDIRLAYDHFEDHMYSGNTYNISVYPFVQRRGIGGSTGIHFNVSAFDTLGIEEQNTICRVPFSQPLFIMCILLIWTLTCVRELRAGSDMFFSVVVRTELTHSMAFSLKSHGEFEKCELDRWGEDWDAHNVVIARLTLTMKVALFILVILPRFCITLVLHWVGCRWLVSTTDFSDLILNACALEFILLIKDLLFLVIVPRRTVIDLERTKLTPSQVKEPDSIRIYVGTLMWLVVAVAWVLAYLGVKLSDGHYINGWQQVLVGYQWDVHNVCVDWVDKRYSD
mmetsp:Transcript_149097/g.478877  ORF Transcript_149097/g.478877 Transcript_149097/m.478877 type:complete len:445 (+) Transcript_149097:54-1388(+)